MFAKITRINAFQNF